MVPQLNIGALFPTYVLILFIPLCWPFLRIDLDKNGLNRVILRFRLGSSSCFPEMEIDIVLTHICTCIYLVLYMMLCPLCLPPIYIYLYAHLVRKKGIRLAAFLLVLQIRLETFSYFFVQVFSQTGFALSVLVKRKKQKRNFLSMLSLRYDPLP